MNKILLIVIFLVSSVSIFGQSEKIAEFKYKLPFLCTLKKSHIIKDEFTGRLCVFLEENGGANLFVLDSNMQLENKFYFNEYKIESVNLTNAIFKEDNLYFISKSNLGYSRYSINLVKGKVKQKYIDFDDKFEKPIAVDNSENKIFIVNAVKNKPVIRVYSWDLTNDLTQNEYSYNSSGFIHSSVLFKKAKSQKSIIQKGLPVDISSVYWPIKVYHGDENLTITLDDKRRTYTFQMNLNSEKVHFYKNSSFIFKENGTPSLAKYNSFLLDDHVIMIVNRLEDTHIYIKNLESDSLKTWFQIKKEEDISFRNSNIFTESGGYYQRTLANTKQFLRKLNGISSKLSICAYKINNEIQLEFGSVIEATSYSDNNTGLSGYIEEKVTKVKCLFDENYKSVAGRIQLNVFDRIKKDNRYEDTDSFFNQSTFCSDNKVYFGRYDKPNKKYLIYTYNH